MEQEVEQEVNGTAMPPIEDMEVRYIATKRMQVATLRDGTKVYRDQGHEVPEALGFSPFRLKDLISNDRLREVRVAVIRRGPGRPRKDEA